MTSNFSDDGKALRFTCLEKLLDTRKTLCNIITEIAGRADVKETKEKREITVVNEDSGETRNYVIPYGSRIKVLDGTYLEAGDELTEGSVNPHDQQFQ